LNAGEQDSGGTTGGVSVRTVRKHRLQQYDFIYIYIYRGRERSGTVLCHKEDQKKLLIVVINETTAMETEGGGGD
jgi:hypothetical protein